MVTRDSKHWSVTACAVLCVSWSLSAWAQADRQLECTSLFSPDMDSAELVEWFGAENVSAEEIYLGEGFYEQGTVLFSDSPADRVEILWNDQREQSRPRTATISGARGEWAGVRSNWATASGITLGTDLLTIEKENRYPFRLMGYGWDGQGITVSWGQGELGRMIGCSLRLRLMPSNTVSDVGTERARLNRLLSGSREFSSGHPAFQELNPRVDRISLIYDAR